MLAGSVLGSVSTVRGSERVLFFRDQMNPSATADGTDLFREANATPDTATVKSL